MERLCPTPAEIEPYIQQGLINKKTRSSGPVILALYNYTETCQRKWAWDRVTRCCRGLILELETGRLVALPFEKFFNLGEVPETSWEALPWERSYAIVEKYDGVLGIIYYHNGSWDIATRGSFDSPLACYAREKLLPRLKVARLREGYTYLTEIIQKGVVAGLLHYDWEGLVLVGRRHNETGKLDWPEKLPGLAEEIGALPPRVYNRPTDIRAFVEELQRSSQLREGVVITFERGLMVKVKTEQYLLLLRALKSLPEEEIIKGVAQGKEEKLLEGVPSELLPILRSKVKHYAKLREDILQRILSYFKSIKGIEDRKSFALAVQEKVPQQYWAFMFALRDNKDLSGLIAKALSKEYEESRMDFGSSNLT